MLKILQGDDTAANNRTITLTLENKDVGDDYSIGFSFCGIERSGPLSPGGTLKFDYTRGETSRLPLGIHYAKVWLEKDGLRQTFADNIQIKVTDSAEEVEMEMETHGNNVTVGITVNTAVPHVDKEPLDKSSTLADVKDVANAMLSAINWQSDPE